VPVIFMTGLTDTHDIVKGLEAGGVDYVTKPIVPDELLARIRVHLANARLAHSARAALDVSGRYLLATAMSGGVLWCTPRTAHLGGHHNSSANSVNGDGHFQLIVSPYLPDRSMI
jgi:DNA-binding response OmpR family regulator